MNRLLFRFRREWNTDIVLTANNERDLEDYLLETYDWDEVTVIEQCVYIRQQAGDDIEIVTLEWIKNI